MCFSIFEPPTDVTDFVQFYLELYSFITIFLIMFFTIWLPVEIFLPSKYYIFTSSGLLYELAVSNYIRVITGIALIPHVIIPPILALVWKRWKREEVLKICSSWMRF